jgi:hypothetical protein
MRCTPSTHLELSSDLRERSFARGCVCVCRNPMGVVCSKPNGVPRVVATRPLDRVAPNRLEDPADPAIRQLSYRRGGTGRVEVGVGRTGGGRPQEGTCGALRAHTSIFQVTCARDPSLEGVCVCRNPMGVVCSKPYGVPCVVATRPLDRVAPNRVEDPADSRLAPSPVTHCLSESLRPRHVLVFFDIQVRIFPCKRTHRGEIEGFQRRVRDRVGARCGQNSEARMCFPQQG